MVFSKKNEASGKEPKKTAEPKPFFGGSVSRLILGLLLAALGAFLLTVAFPPYGFWPLVFCGFVPILVSVHRLMPGRMAGLAMGIGVGGLFWGYFTGAYAGTNAAFLEYLPYVVAFIFIPVGICQKVFHRQTGYRWFLIEGTVVWVGFEMLRGFIPFLGTSAFLANTLYEQFWLIQPVTILSIHGMSFLIILINYVLAQKVMAFIDDRWLMDNEDVSFSSVAANRWLYGTIVLFLVWTGFSMSLLGSPHPSVRVAAVQPGEYEHEVMVRGEAQTVTRDKIEFQEDLEQLIDITQKAGERGAKLVVWNSAALPLDPHVKGTDLLRDLVRETGVYLVISYRGEDANRKKTTILSPDGVFLGSSYQTLIGNIGTASSHDLDFTSRIRGVTRAENRIVAVPAREWPAIASKRFPHIVFRAVENRVPIIKADAHYASGIVDKYGRIIRSTVTEESKRQVLVADVPTGSGDTMVVSWGDWFGWICLLGMVMFLSAEAVITLRQKKVS